MRVLFLDIDGVLNHIAVDGSTPHRFGPCRCEEKRDIDYQMDQEKVFMLNKLVDRFGVSLVLSSSWRHDPHWRCVMASNGIVPEFLDRTPPYASAKRHGVEQHELCRGHNIKEWLDDHQEVTKYAIVDDISEMLPEQLPNFFRTETHKGLTDEIAVAIARHLA